MKELSIFVDESGDFGAYEPHCPYYLVTMVFHDQAKRIDGQLQLIRDRLSYAGFNPDHAFHAMPIIRREGEFRTYEIDERRKLISIFLSFLRKTEIIHHTFSLKKHPGITSIDMTISLSAQLVSFFTEHGDFIRQYDRVVLYYDNGQTELTQILIATCSAIFPHFEYRRIDPCNYRLFQAADFLCSLKLVSLKYETQMLSKTEAAFFSTKRCFEKNYIKAIKAKEVK